MLSALHSVHARPGQQIHTCEHALPGAYVVQTRGVVEDQHVEALTSLKTLMVMKRTRRPLDERRKPMTAPERKAAKDNNCIKHNLSMTRSVEQKIQQAKQGFV